MIMKKILLIIGFVFMPFMLLSATIDIGNPGISLSNGLNIGGSGISIMSPASSEPTVDESLLLETGDTLLLEIGDKLLLE